jgi:CheY-like chemotaxis protein
LTSDTHDSTAVPASAPPARLKLLIVDDDSNTRLLLAEALEVRGAQVHASASAREAQEALVAWHPDLMISDVGMPRASGYELIRRVRLLPVREGGDTPAIACTGYARPEDRVRAMRAGFDAVVAKPVDLDELVEAIAHVAGVRGPVAGGEALAAPGDDPAGVDDGALGAARRSAPDS